MLAIHHAIILLLVHTMVTCVLVGLIWVVQCVHYPSFVYYTQKQAFSDHQRWISALVIPLMLLELITAIWVMIVFSSWPILLGFILLVGIWLHTFLRMVPLHQQLLKDPVSGRHSTVKQLVQRNKIRTGLWSIRAVILATYLYHTFVN